MGFYKLREWVGTVTGKGDRWGRDSVGRSAPAFLAARKAVLEQTVLLHTLKHYLDNIALQEVVYCYHYSEKKTINKGRQTDHYNP